MSKKEALGKGIRALLENLDSEAEDEKREGQPDPKFMGSVTEIPLDQIEINPFQPRADFDEQKLQELSDSIKVHGVIQPVTLRKIGPNKYQLIAGERRLRASKLAGLDKLPAYIRTANDQEMLEIALIENIQRENLNAIEIAVNYKRLIEECDLTQEALGERVSKDRTTVTNYLRLLKLPPEIQKGIKDKKISMGHARALIAVDDFVDQISIYKEIVSRNLSVRQTEELVRNWGQKRVPKEKERLPLAYQKVQDQLSSHFSTRVSLKRKNNGKGEIVIQWFSDEDLNRILDLLDA